MMTISIAEGWNDPSKGSKKGLSERITKKNICNGVHSSTVKDVEFESMLN